MSDQEGAPPAPAATEPLPVVVPVPVEAVKEVPVVVIKDNGIEHPKRIKTIHGFKMKIETDDVPGGVEFPVFASVRKCPDLLDMISEIRDHFMSVSDFILQQTSITDQADADSATKSKEEVVADYKRLMSESQNDQDKHDMKLGDLINKFFVTGFLAAGYPQTEADRLSSWMSAEDYADVKQVCLRGGSLLDLTTG